MNIYDKMACCHNADGIKRMLRGDLKLLVDEELIDAIDAVIVTGARIRSDPGTHELSLAVLCRLMADLAKAQEAEPR